jgi:D-serine deaminase-like pyridoxal phosphate-dependent protein
MARRRKPRPNARADFRGCRPLAPEPAGRVGSMPAPTDDLERLDRATAELDPPFAAVDLDAFRANARDMLRRAGGRPIRLASKSIRCRALLERTLASDPGFRGTLAFTLPEALWLADRGMRDLVVAYPTADARTTRGSRSWSTTSPSWS